MTLEFEYKPPLIDVGTELEHRDTGEVVKVVSVDQVNYYPNIPGLWQPLENVYTLSNGRKFGLEELRELYKMIAAVDGTILEHRVTYDLVEIQRSIECGHYPPLYRLKVVWGFPKSNYWSTLENYEVVYNV